jgi:hypothetical protein
MPAGGLGHPTQLPIALCQGQGKRAVIGMSSSKTAW